MPRINAPAPQHPDVTPSTAAPAPAAAGERSAPKQGRPAAHDRYERGRGPAPSLAPAGASADPKLAAEARSTLQQLQMGYSPAQVAAKAAGGSTPQRSAVMAATEAFIAGEGEVGQLTESIAKLPPEARQSYLEKLQARAGAATRDEADRWVALSDGLYAQGEQACEDAAKALSRGYAAKMLGDYGDHEHRAARGQSTMRGDADRLALAVVPGLGEGRGANLAADMAVVLAEKSREEGAPETAKGLAAGLGRQLAAGIENQHKLVLDSGKEIATNAGRYQEFLHKTGALTQAHKEELDKLLASRNEAPTRQLSESSGRALRAADAAARARVALKTAKIGGSELNSATKRLAENIGLYASTPGGAVALGQILRHDRESGAQTLVDRVKELDSETRASALGAFSRAVPYLSTTEKDRSDAKDQMIELVTKLRSPQDGAALKEELEGLETANAAGWNHAASHLDQIFGDGSGNIAILGLSPAAFGAAGTAADGFASQALKRADELKLGPTAQSLLNRTHWAGTVASGLAALPTLANGQFEVADITEPGKFLSSLAELSTKEGIQKLGSAAGTVFGAVGAGWGVIDSVRKGDKIGILSNSLAFAGAVSMNPYLIATGAVIDLGRMAYNAYEDHTEQVKFENDAYKSMGFSAGAIDKLDGITYDAARLLSEQDPSLSMNDYLESGLGRREISAAFSAAGYSDEAIHNLLSSTYPDLVHEVARRLNEEDPSRTVGQYLEAMQVNESDHHLLQYESVRDNPEKLGRIWKSIRGWVEGRIRDRQQWQALKAGLH